jgi:RNA polymerase sigma-70 factor (ECF subfamily)
MGAVPSDSEETQRLLDRVRSGDREAKEQLLALYRDELRRFAEKRLDPKLRPRLDPSDVVQETYREIVARLDDYLQNPPMPFQWWIRWIAKEQLLMQHRLHKAKKRDYTLEIPLPEPGSCSTGPELPGGEKTPSSDCQRREKEQQMLQVVNQLAETDRVIILMRIFVDLTNQEVAQLLGISAKTASQRFIRALDRLRPLLLAKGLTEL